MYDGERERVHNLLIIKPIRDEAFRRWPNEHHTITIITTYSCFSCRIFPGFPATFAGTVPGFPLRVCLWRIVDVPNPSMTDSAKAKTSPSLSLTLTFARFPPDLWTNDCCCASLSLLSALYRSKAFEPWPWLRCAGQGSGTGTHHHKSHFRTLSEQLSITHHTTRNTHSHTQLPCIS